MATPAILYVDDRNPLISYTPNSSWIRGGNVADYDGTSTLSSIPGASASITFSGKGIRTIPFLAPNIPEFVLSSYSIDNGPTTTHNATEQSAYQFQQNFFQSGPLVPGSHTLVVTHLANNATLFIDYFLVIPPDSPITLAPTSTSVTSSMSATSTAPPAGDGAKTPTAVIIGGTLGGLALIGIAVLVFWLVRKRVKANHHKPPRSLPFHSDSVTEQYQSPGGTYSVLSHPGTVSQFSYPTPSTPSQRIIPPSKLEAVQDARYMPV